MHKTFSPSTYSVYIAGTGITITRANIEDEQKRRLHDGRKTATPEEIVMSFVTPIEQSSQAFPTSKRYKKLLDRASMLMRTPKPIRRKRK